MPAALLRRAQFVFWCGGALLCGFATGAYLGARYYQAMENSRLENALRSHLHGAPPAPSARSPRRKTGSLVGRLEIPRLRLSAIVLEGSDSRTLSVGIGRIPETANPGEAGNVVIGGHRDTFFRPLSGIHNGDRIKMTTPAGAYFYEVDWTRIVDPSDNASLKATPRRSLTLVTCYPFHYVGPAPRRFIVRAHQVVPGVLETSSE
jgi:sortase A